MTNSLEQNQQKIESFIKELNREELVYLNDLVVERIRILDQLETANQMVKFNLGDLVGFADNNGNIHKGRIIKINKKTMGILLDDGKQWNVHPSFLNLL